MNELEVALARGRELTLQGRLERAEAEVRRLRNERDAALNLLEGYAPDLTQRLRDQMEFDREEETGS